MSRIIIPGARTASAARSLVLPDGMKGRASLWFDGVDDKVTGLLPTALTGTSPWTLICWVKIPYDPAATVGVMSGGAFGVGTGIWLGVYNAAGVRTWGGGYRVTADLNTGVRPKYGDWQHIACTYSGGANGTITMYVDGAVAGAPIAFPGSPAVVATTAWFGSLLNATFARCNIAFARIFTRALSLAEVQAAKRGEAISATSLGRRWTCENPGYGTTCHEEIGNTEDAITGALWSPDVPFRRRRVVEDVGAAWKPNVTTSICAVGDDAALQPGAGSCGLMGWFRRGGPVASTTLFAKFDFPVTYRGILAYYSSTADIVVAMVGDGATTRTLNVAVRSGWFHLAVVIDRTAGMFFVLVNGAILGSIAIGALGSVDAAVPLRFGQWPGWFNAAFGSHNDWIWRKGAVFSWDEIEAHYYDGVTPTNPGGGVVQIGWAMRENAGTTVVSIPAGYNGTLSAASWTTATRCHARSAA